MVYARTAVSQKVSGDASFGPPGAKERDALDEEEEGDADWSRARQ